MELLIFLGSLFFFMLLGVPLALVLVLCAIVLMWHSGMWDAMIIPGSMLEDRKSTRRTPVTDQSRMPSSA